MNTLKNPSFLLSAYAPMGFVSYADTVTSLDNIHNYLINGTGCGKSAILKNIAEFLTDSGNTVEYIHSPHNPQNLEAIICENQNIAFFDSNNTKPIYPLIKDEVISLYQCLNKDILTKSSSELIELFDAYNTINTRIIRYVTALGSLYNDNFRTASKSMDYEKINKFTNNLLKKYKHENSTANEEIRLLSAITYNGIVFFNETIEMLADDIVVLNDEHGGASNYILHKIHDNLLKKCVNIITCYCSLAPYDKIEHIIVPDLKIAFVTSNSSHSVNFKNQKNIHCDTRFYNQNSIKLHQHRFSFNQKTSLELLEQIYSLQKENVDIYRKIEDIYTKSCDFEKVNKVISKHINEL